VSAGVTTLLILIWLLATPSNPFSGAPRGTPLPAINRVNPVDVPTKVEQVGTPVPGELPTFVAPVPTGSHRLRPSSSAGYLPQPIAWRYEPRSLGVLHAGETCAGRNRL
jgi:hypothetical protein